MAPVSLASRTDSHYVGSADQTKSQTYNCDCPSKNTIRAAVIMGIALTCLGLGFFGGAAIAGAALAEAISCKILITGALLTGAGLGSLFSAWVGYEESKFCELYSKHGKV